MTVTDFEARVSAYVDGEMSPVEMAEMDRKAAECEHCRVLLADVQALKERMAQLPKVRPSAEFAFALRSHLAMAVSKEKQSLHKVRRALFSSVSRTITTLAAAVVIGLGLTQVVFYSDITTPQMAVERPEIPLVPGERLPNVDVGALELERLSKESYSLDSRHYRDSARVDSALQLKQRPSNMRDLRDVKQVPVSYSF
ncbi:MAG: zf-HC2 domain-containing protein [Candidatus Latescibacteria bacterium]|nr:zf-HC2 domain-containing protein [Candidatus Latescibacterota bacterium]